MQPPSELPRGKAGAQCLVSNIRPPVLFVCVWQKARLEQRARLYERNNYKRFALPALASISRILLVGFEV